MRARHGNAAEERRELREADPTHAAPSAVPQPRTPSHPCPNYPGLLGDPPVQSYLFVSPP